MEFDLTGIHPMIGMPTHRDIPAQTTLSLLKTQGSLQKSGINLTVHMPLGGAPHHLARSRVTKDFLDSECTHLFFIDSDMVWEVDDFMKLCSLGTKLECVCAAYPMKNDKLEIVIDYVTKEVQFNDFGCIPIKGTGLGFTIVQRTIIEQLAAKAPMLRHGRANAPRPSVFRMDSEGDEERSEDMAFFSDIRGLGYTVNLYPNVRLGHSGSKVYYASAMDCIA